MISFFCGGVVQQQQRIYLVVLFVFITVTLVLLRINNTNNSNNIQDDDTVQYIYKEHFKDIRNQIDSRVQQQQLQERSLMIYNDNVEYFNNNYQYHRNTKESKSNPKLGQVLTKLIDLYNNNNNGPIATRTDSWFLNSNSFVLYNDDDNDTTNDSVLIDVVGNIDVLNETGGDKSAIIRLLLKDGYEVINCVEHLCSMYVPINQLIALSNLKYIHFVRPVESVTRVGSVTSEGDIALFSNQARSTYNVNGSGILIGVLSDSYNCFNGASRDIRSNDLPAFNDIRIVADLSRTECIQQRGSDEGRAMMQILHDIAPGSRLAFRTAFRGAVDFASGIRELANIGCDIIVDDISYTNEPFYQDGIISQAVDDVVNRGVIYFSAIGNSGMNAWDAPNGFVQSNRFTERGELHSFGTASNGEPILYQLLSIPNINYNLSFTFQWSEPFYSVSGGNGARSDLDIFFVVDDVIYAIGNETNIGFDPLESFTFNPSTLLLQDRTINVQLFITLFDGPPPKDMKLLYFGGPTIEILFEYGTPGTSTGVGHANSALGAGVGAAPYTKTPAFGITPPVIESFSSFGGTPILFDRLGNLLPTRIIRQQPRFTGPDGGITTFFSRNNRFVGTSAAAPHVAAVAALVLQAAGGRRSLTPAAVYKILQDSAVDMDDISKSGFNIGFDYNTGYGLVNALTALQVVRRRPTLNPTHIPTSTPSNSPVIIRTNSPTTSPTNIPTSPPVLNISPTPVIEPSMAPVIVSDMPSTVPSEPPSTAAPIQVPIPIPIVIPIPINTPVVSPPIPIVIPVPINAPIVSPPIPIVPVPVQIPRPANDTMKSPMSIPLPTPVTVPIPILVVPVVVNEPVPVPKPIPPSPPISPPMIKPPVPVPVNNIPIALPIQVSPIASKGRKMMNKRRRRRMKNNNKKRRKKHKNNTTKKDNNQQSNSNNIFIT